MQRNGRASLRRSASPDERSLIEVHGTIQILRLQAQKRQKRDV